ncbi:MAG: hypothetical protein AB7K09_24530 [Planctomycetota bacterium]
MAKVILQPIGNPIDRLLAEADRERQGGHMRNPGSHAEGTPLRRLRHWNAQ